MILGIPKETKTAERRVALIPQDCARLVAAGAKVLMEEGAGRSAGFKDALYLQSGVSLVPGPEPLFAQAELIVKVKEPQAQELERLEKRHLLFCYLHLGGNPNLTQALLDKGLTAYGFETVGQAGQTPLLAPMSAIAGRLAVQLGARFLMAAQGGRGTLLGGTLDHPGGEVLVLGAGIAGTEAAALAWGMGARVQVLDLRPEALDRLVARLPGVAVEVAGPGLLERFLPQTDLLVGAVYLKGRKAPRVVSTQQMGLMPKGAVAVDISIDQGGCFETSRPCTHESPTYLEQGVIHSAITNLPAAVPHTASVALSKAITPFVLQLLQGKRDLELQAGLNLEAGQLRIEL
ncbi:MAG: hypothetical protein A2600_08630 [Candidatus Lambdaproteobacteria bacterium RIFOXYD1_FULL_56_27]|uniref:alanine dehydrogenase n=1 Tax=Candidatus Lambdaproteobacteria bacterium RIFOXYD2_FULL_56_26 TaxID=1817773 RepID=A0A1F6GZ86_9PROT|nr:MAG: hypothetical protein A2426_10050 [Candidatus Lambdaproteobacteria bacterium RIFOXYC1_FULL_56_13]OGH03399.1 MAG: hypothetical protein A2557_02635 [Candidatus Lambdaproteobacteria bacterium RIFOXYD2_FULL_56_26]OGH06596.1 MAG: hypothetical protein A2600_08630 [Candidatus Lambdaproteobacteria bacterium RIFOXYD1_FULL_56_27]